MGVVFRASDAKLGRDVAIKVRVPGITFDLAKGCSASRRGGRSACRYSGGELAGIWLRQSTQRMISAQSW